MDNIKVVPGKLLVEPIKVEETSSGFVNIEIGNSTPVRGKVVKAPRGTFLDWLQGRPRSPYKEGDTLYFRRYSVDELNFRIEDGSEKSLFIVEFEDVVLYEPMV